MAGAGYKVFASGDVLSASDVNTYMMQQTVMVFANASARTSALSAVLSEGMVSYLQDTNSLEVYDGSAWVGATGDITGLTAGTGVSITSPSGPVPTVAIDTAVVPQLSAVNTFTGQNIINAAGTSTVDLIVRATASQTANLQEWQESGGQIRAYVMPSGLLRVRTSDTSSASIVVGPASASQVPLIVEGLASQTGDLSQWRNSSGGTVASVNPSGVVRSITGFASTTSGLTFLAPNFDTSGLGVSIGGAAQKGLIIRGAASQTASLTEWQTSAGTATTVINSGGRIYSNQRMSIGFPVATPVVTAHSNFSNDTDAARIVALFRGASGQSANITEWQDSSSTVLSYINSTGGFVWGPTFTSFLSAVNGRAEIQTNAAGVVPLTVKGFASQTANLMEFKDSASTNVLTISPVGAIRSGSRLSIGNTGNDFGVMSVTIGSPATIGAVVRGAASQTASLTEWQTSAGTVVAKVTATGAIQATNLTSLNNWVFTKEESGGGQIRLKKMTAAAANNRAADFAQLYFRDGTNAGTLKLVVIAGTTGTETTILDNISQ